MLMKYLILTGGLGNQMFEYAFLLALRLRGFRVKVDISYYDFFKMHNGYELDRVFGINEKVVNRQRLHILLLRFMGKFAGESLYMKDNLCYDSRYLAEPGKYIKGNWQDERYFEGVEVDLRNIFRFKNIDEYNLSIAREMQASQSVSLHIRRGDYASFGMTIIDESYYRKAINYINSYVTSPVYYIFSDDDITAKAIAESIGIKYKLFVHNRGRDSFKDMYLMSQCKYNIIANSSFSWWGAWLNDNDEKIVVAPQIWDTKNSCFHPQSSKWILI